jgi:hypothetical protein
LKLSEFIAEIENSLSNYAQDIDKTSIKLNVIQQLKIFGRNIAIIKEKVLDRFDHKNLNKDTEEFKTLSPTAENIAVVIYDLIRAKLEEKFTLKIRLYETERNFVEYPTEW